MSDRLSDRSLLRAVTRLAVGGALNGYHGLRNRIDVWEARRKLDSLSALAEPDPVDEVLHYGTPPGYVDAAFDAPAPQLPVHTAAASESERDRLRYALIGAVFALEESAGRGLNLAVRSTNLAGRILHTVAGPVYGSRVLQPLRSQVDSLAERGQQVVDTWITAGRSEEQLSRSLADEAVSERVENVIHYLTANEEVQELVQSQSAGLVDNVIEETRERSVSADNFIEALVRSILRRPPRWDMPDPPPEISAQAQQQRQIAGRSLRR